MANREERIILDPPEVAFPDRAELNLHDDNIRVLQEGIDWGDTAIEAFMSQGQMGENMVDYRLPNRTIRIPLILGATGDFDAARLALQAKVARINEEGGWLKRELIGGSYGEAGKHLFCDIVKATLKYGGSTWAASQGFDPDAELVLEAQPDFYGDQISLGVHSGTGDVAWTEQIKGNLPGRAILNVVDESGNDQFGLAFHFRCRNYSAGAKWAYEAESLEALDVATVVTLTGASGGGSNNAVRHNNLSTEWTSVLGTGYLPHKGVYTVLARVYTTSEETPWLRLSYAVGDPTGGTPNQQVRVPAPGHFYLLNLGQINLTPSPFGEHRWRGVIQGRGEVGGENLYIDRLYFLAADESSGLPTGRIQLDAGEAGGYVGRDAFDQTAGNLAGKTAPTGGSWVGAGSDPEDLKVTGSGTVTRTATLDTFGGVYTDGRVDTLSGLTALTAQAVQATVETTAVKPAAYETVQGVVARYSNISNFALAAIFWYGSGNLRFVVVRRVGGVNNMIGYEAINELDTNTPYTMTFGISAGGVWVATLEGPSMSKRLTGGDTYLATGGALEKGSVGLVDVWGAAMSCTRTYDNFLAWAPNFDPVLFGGREAQIATPGLFRQTSDGAAFAPMAYRLSDLPRVPVSGPEERPVEIAVRPTRGDFGETADTSLDAFESELLYRPCWSYVPEP